jgi:hypothetical protein
MYNEKDAQVKVVNKKRAVFEDGRWKAVCGRGGGALSRCLLRSTQKFLSPSIFHTGIGFCLVLAYSFSPQTIKANKIP